MKILAVSDTHGFHKDLKDFDGIDMIIHAGDFSNSKSPVINQSEAVDFLDWYNNIPVKYKILIAGNHDTSIECKLVRPSYFKDIIYLEHESVYHREY
jgi:predicted phosphodiesterase